MATCTYFVILDLLNVKSNFQPVSEKILHYSTTANREIPSMDLEMILVFDENSVAPRRVGDVDDFAAVHLSSVVYGLGEFRVKASILLYNILVLSALSTFFYSTKFLSTDDSVRVRQKAAWRRRYRQHHCCNVPPS